MQTKFGRLVSSSDVLEQEAGSTRENKLPRQRNIF